MTQMIARYHVADFARFRSQFDADAEDRGNNGLSLLQLWRENDSNAWRCTRSATPPGPRPI